MYSNLDHSEKLAQITDILRFEELQIPCDEFHKWQNYEEVKTGKPKEGYHLINLITMQDTEITLLPKRETHSNFVGDEENIFECLIREFGLEWLLDKISEQSADSLDIVKEELKSLIKEKMDFDLNALEKEQSLEIQKKINENQLEDQSIQIITNLINMRYSKKPKDLILKVNGSPSKITDINNFMEIISLDLSGNNLEDLPETFKLCNNIKKLDLSGNHISSIPITIKHLKNLEELDLTENKIKDLPEFLFNFKNLRKLYLGINEIESIPSEISNLFNLEYLTLYNNQIKEIPQSIGNLIRLKQLDLAYNRISFIPETICDLLNLEELVLEYNDLTSLPANIGNLTKLRELNIEMTKIKELPSSIDDIQNLEIIK